MYPTCKRTKNPYSSTDLHQLLLSLVDFEITSRIREEADVPKKEGISLTIEKTA